MDCHCEKLQEAIKKGLKSMKEKKAPSIVIQDWVMEMMSGDWNGCENCKERE